MNLKRDSDISSNRFKFLHRVKSAIFGYIQFSTSVDFKALWFRNKATYLNKRR